MIDFSFYEYRAVLVHVADGDTVDLNVDLGFRVHIKDRFRLLRIDTPERGQPGYGEAKIHIQEVMAADPNVQIRTQLDREDVYGRMLADVWYWPLGALTVVNLNDEMLALGLAVPYAK